MRKKLRIPIDEIDAELTREGWILMKSKIMGWIISGKVDADEGVRLIKTIDKALESAVGLQAKEQALDENRSDSNLEKTN